MLSKKIEVYEGDTLLATFYNYFESVDFVINYKKTHKNSILKSVCYR